jgi:polyhydroxyalkanoate synthesis repressor PhaR
MSNARIIKKYPNRRLYDTGRGRYITLEDVQRLAQEGTDFIVIDHRSDEEITHNILLQALSALEEGQPQMLSKRLLVELIRRYGAGSVASTGRLLEVAVGLPHQEEGRGTAAAPS